MFVDEELRESERRDDISMELEYGSEGIKFDIRIWRRKIRGNRLVMHSSGAQADNL